MDISEQPSQPPAPASGICRAPLFGMWLRDVVFSIVLAVLMVTFLYQPVRVEGTSMAPQLQDHARVFVNKLAYHVGPIHRDDVVIFHYPNDPSKTYIKRIIAEPGDTVRIEQGIVYLNGHLLSEPYVPEMYRDDRSLPETTIPAGEFFVLGDHRDISSDSRDFGPVPRSFIYGRAMFIYWPTGEAGWIH